MATQHRRDLQRGAFLLIALILSTSSCLSAGNEGKKVKVAPINLRELWRTACTPVPYRKIVFDRGPLYPNVSENIVDADGSLPHLGASGRLYFLTGETLKCFAAAEGRELWRKRLTSPWTAQVGEWDKAVALYEYNNHNGILTIVAGENGETLKIIDVPNYGVLAVESGRIVLFGRSFLRTYDISTGRLLWQKNYSPTSGTELLSCRLSGNDILIETFGQDYGHHQVMSLDYLGGGARWSALGKAHDLRGGTAYIVKEREGELWTRTAGAGELISVLKLDHFDNRYLKSVENAILYTSDQRYHAPESVLISGDKGREIPPSHFVVKELLLFSPKASRVLWSIAYEDVVQPGCNAEFFLRRGVVVVASSAGERFLRLVGFDATDGRLLWNLEDSRGISGFALGEHHLIVTTFDGTITCYQY